MDIIIEYCVPCGFIGTAEKLKKDIMKKFGSKVDVKLKEGEHGIFDIYVNKKLVFSRFKERRFPEFPEVQKFIENEL